MIGYNRMGLNEDGGGGVVWVGNGKLGDVKYSNTID